VRRNLKLAPLIVGGGQESERRSGTENVVGIVGFGAAARLARGSRPAEGELCRGLEDNLWKATRATGLDIEAVGDRARAVPGIVAVRLGRSAGDLAALRLDAEGFSVATGSACDSGKREPSRAARSVLGEQGAVRGFVRISFGRGITGEDIALLSDALTRVGR
jgi:cysteine desulfurase